MDEINTLPGKILESSSHQILGLLIVHGYSCNILGISIPLMRENQGTHLPLSHLLRHTTPPQYSQCLRVRAAPSDARRSKIAMAFDRWMVVAWLRDVQDLGIV